MLRTAVVAAGMAMLFGGIVATGYGLDLAWWLLASGGLLLIGTLGERVLYKQLESRSPGGNWVKTSERFVDPETGKIVDVFYDPAAGERRYVALGEKEPR